MISLTDKAQAMIKQISEAEGIGHLMVRVCIKGGGCSGFTHDMTFDNQVLDLDEVIIIDDISIIIDQISLQYLQGTVIDYQDHLMSSGFKFSIPKITGSCGCGNSVSF